MGYQEKFLLFFCWCQIIPQVTEVISGIQGLWNLTDPLKAKLSSSCAVKSGGREYKIQTMLGLNSTWTTSDYISGIGVWFSSAQKSACDIMQHCSGRTLYIGLSTEGVIFQNVLAYARVNHGLMYYLSGITSTDCMGCQSRLQRASHLLLASPNSYVFLPFW